MIPRTAKSRIWDAASRLMPAHPRAVFLSYASQDAAVAKAIAEALRAAGIIVWLDRSELRGGDVWDAHIQRQIAACTLFVPVISAHTQGRREGYFRLEWRLAEERMRCMALGTPFLVPVVVDKVRERDALVPRSFVDVHWTRFPSGDVSDDFVCLVQQMLARGTLRGETLMHVPCSKHPQSPAPGDYSVITLPGPSLSGEVASDPVAPKPAAVRLWWVLLAVGVVGLVAATWVVVYAGFER